MKRVLAYCGSEIVSETAGNTSRPEILRKGQSRVTTFHRRVRSMGQRQIRDSKRDSRQHRPTRDIKEEVDGVSDGTGE